ncbi:hypothetical protein L1887_11551 [Cichorium endivia]|nr:hypothetical protein L1887_11551 [Cichorium endivia]
MERKLSGVTIYGKILEVNLARYGRNRKQFESTTIRRRPNVVKVTHDAGTRDYHSYAEVLRPDVKISEAVADPTPVILQKCQGMFNWIGPTTVIGEAKSITHLGHLPRLLQDKDENVLEIKYLGGLKVLLIFSTSMNVEAFIKDKNKWNEYFKYEEGEIRSDDEDGDDNSIKEGDEPMLVDDRRLPTDMIENSSEKSNGHNQTSLDERDSASRIEETGGATENVQVTDDIPNGGDPDQSRVDPINNPATQPIQNLVGSLNGLVSSGCFSPFSSPIKQKSTEDTDQFFEFGGSIGKRRNSTNKFRAARLTMKARQAWKQERRLKLEDSWDSKLKTGITFFGKC